MKLKDNPFRKEITQGLLLALFYEIYNIYQGHVVQERIPKSRKEDLFERFIRAVSESYKEERSVSYYADKMFLTAKHLSTVVKEISGKTAGEWIDSLVVLEAKALLKSSEMSIQEIADELHFANQSFFGKYFKHHTGMSPKAVSYTHLRAHETGRNLVCRLLLEKKKKVNYEKTKCSMLKKTKKTNTRS